MTHAGFVHMPSLTTPDPNQGSGWWKGLSFIGGEEPWVGGPETGPPQHDEAYYRAQHAARMGVSPESLGSLSAAADVAGAPAPSAFEQQGPGYVAALGDAFAPFAPHATALGVGGIQTAQSLVRAVHDVFAQPNVGPTLLLFGGGVGLALYLTRKKGR